jgi:Zn-dependent protease with chaperone function
MFQATTLLICSILFLLLYFGILVFCVYLIYWAFDGPRQWILLRILVVPVALLVFFVLLKGLITKHGAPQRNRVEIKEKDNPLLYDFIDQLCQEVGAPFPKRIYAMADVNAMVSSSQISFLNLFVPIERDLVIGLGLVNCVNLSEFKAIMAHEMAHSAQSGFIHSYSLVVARVILGIVQENDWLDQMLQDGMRNRNNNMQALCAVAYFMIFGIRKAMWGMFYGISVLYRNIGRQQEFNADLCAVRVAGSDAIVHGLKRTLFGHESLMQAWQDLEVAADNRLYSADVYFHQAKAAEYLRKMRKDPSLGRPPELRGALDGKNIQVFDPDDDSETPMWAHHPPLFDREENAKQIFVAGPVDERSPWLLFDRADKLKEKITLQQYNQLFKVPRNMELSEPEQVQQFIDDEHQELIYDERYGGVYDGRPIRPGDIEEILELVAKEPWDDERLIRVQTRLYQGLTKRGEDFREAQKEHDRLMRDCRYRPTGRTKRIVDDYVAELDEHYAWFKSFDRRVTLVHLQMAKRLPDPKLHKDLVARYRFHLPLQNMHLTLRQHFNEADSYAVIFFRQSQEQWPGNFVGELMYTMRMARKALKNALKEARDLDVPMLRNLMEDQTLDEYLLDQNLISELPEEFIRGDWVMKFMQQLIQVIKKTAMLRFKSMSYILNLQEQIAKEFKAIQPPAAIIEEEEGLPEAITDE